MARPVTTLIVFFVALNLFAAMFASTGVAAMLGLDVTVGEEAATNELRTQTEEVPTGTGFGDTLFGMYNVMGGFLSNVYDYIFPGLRMLNRAGIPVYLTDRFMGDLFGVLIAIDIAAYTRGYDI